MRLNMFLDVWISAQNRQKFEKIDLPKWVTCFPNGVPGSRMGYPISRMGYAVSGNWDNLFLFYQTDLSGEDD